MKKRIILFDILKAISVIEIVAFWHMFDYTSIDAREVPFGSSLTSAVLAAFTFSSGFFLGKKMVPVGKFYTSRLKRFMLPLLTSLVIMYAFGAIDSFRTVLFSAIGLSCFIPPMAPTLWFFSMIILCYIITPLILWDIERMDGVERVVNIFLRGLLFFALITCIGINPKVQQYFLFYIFGMVIDIKCVESIVRANVVLKTGGGILWLIMNYLGMYSMVSDVLGIMLLICLCDIIERNSNSLIKMILERIAYSSMFAYLFHREFYQIAKRLFHLPDSTIPMYGIVITVFVIFIMSYYGQRMYDIVINKLSRQEKA